MTITKQVKINEEELSTTIKSSVEINGLSNASKRIAKYVSDMVSLAYRDFEVQYKLHENILKAFSSDNNKYIIRFNDNSCCKIDSYLTGICTVDYTYETGITDMIKYEDKESAYKDIVEIYRHHPGLKEKLTVEIYRK